VGALAVTGLEAARVGELAAGAGIVLHELTPRASLEEAFLEMTSGSLEFGVHDPGQGVHDPGQVAAAAEGAR
jgi:ABC-2 type transport system ATP-binding protein